MYPFRDSFQNVVDDVFKLHDDKLCLGMLISLGAFHTKKLSFHFHCEYGSLCICSCFV